MSLIDIFYADSIILSVKSSNWLGLLFLTKYFHLLKQFSIGLRSGE